MEQTSHLKFAGDAAPAAAAAAKVISIKRFLPLRCVAFAVASGIILPLAGERKGSVLKNGSVPLSWIRKRLPLTEIQPFSSRLAGHLLIERTESVHFVNIFFEICFCKAF